MNNEFENFSTNSNLESMSEIIVFSTSIFILILVTSVVLYAIQAIAMMKISKKRGYDKAWLAWVPVANNFLIPILVNDDVKGFVRGRLPVIYGVLLILSAIPVVGFLFSILLAIISLYATYTLLSQYTNNAVGYLVTTVITLGFAMPFLLLRISKRERIDSEYSY